MHTMKSGIRRLTVGLALGSLLIVGLAVAPRAQAADICVFEGSGTVSPGVKTQAEPHTYSFSGTATCASGTHSVTGSGSGSFGCFEPGTSTATIKITGVATGSVSFQHSSVAMTGTGSGAIKAAQMLFYVTDPVQGGRCASTGLGGADLVGVFAVA